jgi:glycosyltransferase involved in cell wall biosynthesis
MVKTLRIAWITNNFTPYTSGVTQSLQALLPALQALGHEIRIITLDFATATHAQDPFWVIRVPSVVRFNYQGNPMALPWRSCAYVTQLLSEFDPDVMHSHHPFLLGIAALKAAQILHKPLVFTYHTLYHDYAHRIPLIPQWITRKIIHRQVVRYCHAVNRIIVPSSTVINAIDDQVYTHKIQVIPSGVRTALVPAIKPRVDYDHFSLLVVSRFVVEKNLHFILDAYARLYNRKRYTLILAGYGMQLHDLQQYAYVALGCTHEQVQFVVRPDTAMLAQLYAKAHIFLFSSHTDTQGIVLAEAMVHGVPVIACHGPGQHDIVRHGDNGFLVEQPTEMAKLVERCYADRQLYRQLREQAWLTGHRYDPHVLVHDVVRVYQEAMRD